MSYEKVLQSKKFVIGTKQTVKALNTKNAKEVIVAKDAATEMVSKVTTLANHMEIPVTYVDSMSKLGKACGIDVKAAAVAIII